MKKIDGAAPVCHVTLLVVLIQNLECCLTRILLSTIEPAYLCVETELQRSPQPCGLRDDTMSSLRTPYTQLRSLGSLRSKAKLQSSPFSVIASATKQSHRLTTSHPPSLLGNATICELSPISYFGSISMSLAKRIIPCLDVDKGRVVKGVNFVDIRDAGDPVEVARRYNEQGADEITFLDITASHEGRDTTLHTVEQMASEVFIPLTVGGGIRELVDIRNLLNAGADKVGINSAAVHNPEFVKAAADRFGSQCIVVAIDAKQVSQEGEPMRWEIFTHGGRRPTGIDAIEWAKKMCDYGAGEILLTSMDRDGTKNGFDLKLTSAVSEAVHVPVIASGGVGTLEHLADGITLGKADAVLAASIFHYGEHSVGEAKEYMAEQGIEVRR